MFSTDPFDNIILLTDSYKVSHSRQYPPGTTQVVSYFESRGGEAPETVFFGLQYMLKRFLMTPVTMASINEAEEFFNAHFGACGGAKRLFNRAGWEYIVRQHGGRLPLRIRAVPEGTRVPVHNVLMTIENTDPACYWLTNYVETLLVQTWYPTTIATLSNRYYQLIYRYLVETGDPAGVDFKLHDFGFRGSTSVESSGIGGLAHLVNFLGTDTMSALILGRKFYGCPMAGFSIPAAEHSTITSWGREHEVDAFRNMLTQYPEGLVAVVSDSFNIYDACTKLWGDHLRNEVLNRNGTVVIRPDSGKPAVVVPEVLRRLRAAFGAEQNRKGFWVLNPHVRVIQGDGINLYSCGEILEAVKMADFSADNLAFGSGGGLLQMVNRDTHKFAFKCCEVTVEGEHREVYKEPITDPGKNSKRGRLKLLSEFVPPFTHDYQTVNESAPGTDTMLTVWENGQLLVDWTLDEVRTRAKFGLAESIRSNYTADGVRLVGTGRPTL